MNLDQQCLIAIVFDEYRLCRQWRLIVNRRTVYLSALYASDWNDSLPSGLRQHVLCKTHDVHLFIFRAQWYRWPTFQECEKACWSFRQTEWVESVLSTSASCLHECYQWWVQSHDNQKKLSYLKEACKIKQLIKMLNNMHENCVWGRPAETNLLSSNWTKKKTPARPPQDCTELWE